MNVLTDYRARLAARQAALGELERRHAVISRVRLGLALLAGALLLGVGVSAWPWVAGLVVLFVVAAVAHARVLAARERARRAVTWYERGLERLDHEWVGHGDPGDRLRPASHLYADDLDLFGRGSLFELLSTPRTRAGQDTLAAWLLSPATPDVILARQAAVRELAALPDLRETIAVLGEGVTIHAASLREWATARPAWPAPWWPVPFALVAAANITMLALYLSTARYDLASLGLMILASLAILSIRDRVVAVILGVETPTRDLAVLSGLMRTIEQVSFSAPSLQRLTAALRPATPGLKPGPPAGPGVGHSASAEIVHLEALVGRLAWRRNMLFALPAALMMWATQCAFAIDRWRRRVGPRVPGWLDLVGEFEALAALATFAAEHPAYVFPTLEPAPAHLAATGLGHPLLASSAIQNDVAIGAPHAPDILVVSGSNMSGKSTFLRALGVNVVLAQAGGPVRATRFTLSPLEIGASIRVLDSLQDGHSRFFAEISRLKQLVDLTRAHPGGVLFLLDEILAGTNSHDRAQGADALLAGLTHAGAIGLVTTHDLALSQMADARAPRAANVHFADEFDEGGLSFDYHLRPGPVRTSNALALMRSIGLDV